MKHLVRMAVAALFCVFSTTIYAKTVTINVADVSFETLKTLVSKDKTIGVDLSGVADNALKVILDKRKTLTIDDTDLPTELRARLEAAKKISEVTTSLKAAQEWSDMGRGIGVAVREGLSAVTDETAKFADTTPGKFTMVMIAWKVMGQDFITTVRGILIGIPLLIFWICIWVWWLKRVYGYHKVKKVTIGEDNKKIVTYEEMPPLSVQWNKDWAEKHSKLTGKDLENAGLSDWVGFSAIKSVGFVVVMFLIWWWII